MVYPLLLIVNLSRDRSPNYAPDLRSATRRFEPGPWLIRLLNVDDVAESVQVDEVAPVGAVHRVENQ